MFTRRPLWLLAALVAVGWSCGDDGTARTPPSERSWSAPEALEESRIATLIRATTDVKGNALVVWDDLEGKVNAKRYDASNQTWLDSQRLDPDNPDDSAIPDLAMSGEGNAVAVWQRQSQVDDTRSVWTSRYDASTGGWGRPTSIENSTLVLAPQVVMDRAGNALLAFTRSEIGASVMTASFSVAHGSWSAAKPIAPARGLFAAAPQLAMAPGGTAVAVWADGTLANSTIWAASYDVETEAWQEAQAIGTKPGMALPGGVAINEAETAAAVWTLTEGERSAIYTSRSDARRWSEPERLDREGSGDASGPRIVLDGTGNSLAIWSTQTAEHRQVWTNRYDKSTRAWQGAQTLDAGDFDAYAPTLAITRDGHAVAIWTHEDAARLVPYTSVYDAAEQTWSAPSALESEAEARSDLVALALTHEGSALAVWSRAGKRMVASHLR